MKTNVAIFALLMGVTAPSLAGWVAHADFSSCPRKYYPNTSGQEGGFASESACQARVAQAKRQDTAVCIRYTCRQDGGGSGGGTASTGNALDDAYARAMAASSNSNQMMQASGMYLGAKLLEGALQGPTPEQQAAAAAQRQYEAELAAQRAIEAEQRKNQLLSEMQDIEGSGGELQLLTGDDDGSGGGELALMDDDGDTRGIMGKRKTPKAKRNQPPAVRKNPGPYTLGAKPDAGNGQLAMNFGDDEAPAPGNPNVPPRPAPGPDPFNQGTLDGEACNQRNAGALCGARAADDINRCLADYNRGYDQGARRNERRLTARGTEMGRRDRPSGRNAAMSYNEARGSCGNIFIQAYNNAFR